MADPRKLHGHAVVMLLLGILNSGKLWVFGFCGFLGWLKVVHGADISWWWVFAPFWLPMAICVSLFVGFTILFLVVGFFAGAFD